MALEPGPSDTTDTVELPACCVPKACPDDPTSPPFGASVCVRFYKRTGTYPDYSWEPCATFPPVTLTYAGLTPPFCDPDPNYGLYTGPNDSHFTLNPFIFSAPVSAYYLHVAQDMGGGITGIVDWPVSGGAFDCPTAITADCETGCVSRDVIADGTNVCSTAIYTGCESLGGVLRVTVCPGDCEAGPEEPDGFAALVGDQAARRVPLPCLYLGESLTAVERIAAGKSHLRDWRWCGAGLGPVCRCAGCGPSCPKYLPDPAAPDL